MTRDQVGRYRLLRSLGQGGVGSVHLALDSVLEREVALKHLRPDLGLSETDLRTVSARMQNEAKAAARVAHPSFVALHDMGEDPELGVYLVFEHVPGATLRQRLAKGPLSPPEVATLARGLGDALSLAHAAGIVHRDVKPENVILAPTGAKLADFGIARVPGSRLTAETLLFGTIAYSAPETLDGAGFGPASDQFALAAVAYEALLGEPAFGGSDAIEMANALAASSPAPIAARLGLHPSVDAVLCRGLAHDPAARFPSCRAFAVALAEALETPLPKPAPPPTRRQPRAERSRLHVALGVAAVVAVGVLLYRTARSEGAPAREAPAASQSAAGVRAPCASSP